eukprot:7670679-Heterocapsa_arctica.AAC.1
MRSGGPQGFGGWRHCGPAGTSAATAELLRGASYELAVARPLLEGQQRGGWGSLLSVHKYEGHGCVSMELQKFPIDKRDRLREQERGSAGRCAVICAAHLAQRRP